ncbi:MAG: CDP-diacylglycerol--serine O-phosphatidyltransferase [Acidobacteria bacterium]|nr:CDP-diacylglycerol--serine O-phosphatidyltransferase [Acidobacteriota bacterium]
MNLDEAKRVPARQGIRRGIYIIPSLFTIGNILCGFYALVNCLKGAQAQQLGDMLAATTLFDQAAVALMISWLLDNIDGRIARLTNTTSEFGVELDSIADFLSFGIAPALLAYTWGYGLVPGLEKPGWAVSFFFLICSALRLARFNVIARTAETSAAKGVRPDKRFFVGLPTPGAAGLVASFIHFFPGPLMSRPPAVRNLSGTALLVALTLLALLMVSTIRYSKYINVGARLRHPFVTLPLISLFVAGVWFYSRWVMLILAASYVVHGPILRVAGFLARRFLRKDSLTA